jgi:hypothetical protein
LSHAGKMRSRSDSGLSLSVIGVPLVRNLS